MGNMREDMIQKALRLKELDKQIIRAIATSDMDQFISSIEEFNDTKKQIRSFGLENPVVNLHAVENDDARIIIQKIMSGIPFPVEKALAKSSIEEFLIGELNENDIETLGSDLFYSWFSHYEYIKGLFEIGSLIISCGKIPANLSGFMEEARHCYAFQQYIAVFSLCRTILEVCIKDIATNCQIIPKDSENVRQMALRTPELNDLIEKLCDGFTVFSVIRNQLHRVRKKTNSIIHGTRLVHPKEAKEILKDTVLVIHQLYELEITRTRITE